MDSVKAHQPRDPDHPEDETDSYEQIPSRDPDSGSRPHAVEGRGREGGYPEENEEEAPNTYSEAEFDHVTRAGSAREALQRAPA